MSAMGRLTITRKKRMFLRNVLLLLFVDEKSIGTLANGQTKTFDLTNGSHDVYVKMGVYRSVKKRILVKKNHQLNLVSDMASAL